jgi:superfamily II DNA or RNA helicase
MPLSSAFPEFAEVIGEEHRAKAGCQLVTGLTLSLDGDETPIPCLMWSEILLVDMDQLSRLPLKQRREAILFEMANAGWLAMDVAAALKKVGDEEVHQRRADVAAGETLAQRVLRAVGGNAEGLYPALGELSRHGFIRGCEPEQLAELALSRLGSALLSALVPAMEAQGLRPPTRWNTPEARNFVAEIGFPPEFAGSPTSKREAETVISGPIHLPPLHKFQEEVVAGITNLLNLGQARKRAVVSLPTGGGKTRVTVEACVMLILKPESERRSVLWIAQSDELCEQAVQAFRQVWLNRGAERTDLRISRLWGSNPTPAPPAPGRPAVVVASIQTLNARMGNPSLEWLKRPGMVVVDECHHAITTSYTSLLRWLDAEAPRGKNESKDEPPILGLSATPFRTDEDESMRLAKRFDGIWFPEDQAGLHDKLLGMGVLSHAERVPLASTATLSPQELKFLESQDVWEGLQFDNFVEALNQRLADDPRRNRLIVDTILKSSERSILLFANSVSHAEELAARLHLAGVPAAAISGSTPRSARRWLLDRFQRGEIRVICNHSVLTTGFDAPKTDLVFISRQVFSPVRYMQMVGRGLRGELNGGTSTCRIVTVLDNLGRFGDRHPYHYCARYFQSTGDFSNREI